MKKKICMMLVCLLLLSIFPIDQFISFALNFEPDYTHTRAWFEAGSTEAQNKIKEAQSYLNTVGVPKYNKNFQNLNEITFAMYGIAVYGYPHGDRKTPNDAEYDYLKREEYRYLGYDTEGNDVTNTYFPDDTTSTNQDLLTKDWQMHPDNLSSWTKADNNEDIINYIFFTAKLTYNGEEIPYTASQIIGITDINTLKKYVNLQTVPMFSIDGSVRLYSKGGDGVTRYRTFIVERFAGDKTLQTSIVAEGKKPYIIKPYEDYIDIPVTVSGRINTSESFLESYIAERWVEFEGVKKAGESYTYTKRIYKSQIGTGLKEFTLTGKSEIKSSFVGDSAVIDIASTNITVTVAQDNLIAQLNVPQTGAINTSYMVKNVSYIPQGATVISSKLEKKIGSGSFEEVSSWNGSHMQDIHPVKTTITYRLTIVLDNGQIGSDTKSIQILDSRAVDATADLILSEYTYEGHPAYARDDSVFDVEGETYYASQAYEVGLAENDFDVLESTPHSIERLSDTTAKITFQNRGYYNVRLDVFTQDGKRLFDIEPIEVRRTPYIEDNLGGTQKENRKQILNLSVAIKPSNPITNFWVEIEDTETGEKVHVVSSKNNSSTIKTRDIISSSTAYYQNYTLEFLTKNTTEKVYKYTAYVRDSKGDTDTVSETFTVYPDLPPAAQIDMLDSFIRNPDSNIAEIIAEDGTVSSDGDQVERTWRIRRDTNNNNIWDATELLESMSAYNMKDLSFGSGQKVSFEKPGVGLVRVRLDVKEVWIEPTLEEYVTDADRKTGAITKDVVVDNIAPMVSLEPINTYPVDMLIVTTPKDYNQAVSRKNELEAKFIENGIDGKITIKAIDQPNSLNNISFLNQKSDTLTYDSNIWNKNVISIDNINNYRVRASSLKVESGKVRNVPPYIIEAFNNETNALKWSYTINEENFNLSTDNENKYLYLIFSDKTILLDKSTGAYIVTIEFKINGSIYNTDRYLYIFNRDGIFKYDKNNSQLIKIHDSATDITRMINGKVQFVTPDKETNTVFRGIFNLESEELKKEYIKLPNLLDKINNAQYISGKSGAGEYYTLDMDNKGLALLVQNSRLYPDSLDGRRYYVISSDNNILKVINIPAGSTMPLNWREGFVLNEKGEAVAVYSGRGEPNHDIDRLYVNVYDIYSSRVSIVPGGYYLHDGSSGLTPLWAKNVTKQNCIYVLTDARNAYISSISNRGYKINLNDFSQSDYSGLSEIGVSSNEEYYRDSDLYFLAMHVLINSDSQTRKINILKYLQTLEDTLERTITKNMNFREEAQKYVVVMDDVYVSDKTYMQGIINKLKNQGVKFIFAGDNLISNAGNYGDLIYQAVGGVKLEYGSDMSENFDSVSSYVISEKAKIAHVGEISIPGSGSVRLRKNMPLEPSTVYEYEYDIKYLKDFTNKNINILSTTFSQVDNLNYGFSTLPTGAIVGNPASSWYLKDVFYEDFQDKNLHSLITPNDGLRWINGVYGRSPIVPSGYYTVGGGGSFYINMEKDGIVTFDYYTFVTSTGSELNPNYYFAISVNGNQILKKPGRGVKEGKISIYLPKGNNLIGLSQVNWNNDVENPLIMCIDNLKVQYLVQNSTVSARDEGKTPSSVIKNVKAGEVYHVKDTIRVPGNPSKLLRIPNGIYQQENFSDTNLEAFMSLPSSLYNRRQTFAVTSGTAYSEGGRAKSSLCREGIFNVNVNIPEGMNAYLTFDVRAVADTTYYINSPLDRTIYKYKRVYDYDGDYYELIPTSASTSDNNWKTVTIQLENGDNGIYIPKDYENSYQGAMLANVYVDNIKITYTGMTTSLDNMFYPISKYTGNTQIDLLISDTGTLDAEISNFKLYQVIEGKKYLVLKEDFIDLDNFNNTWTVYKTNANITLSAKSQLIEEEKMPMVYKKGQLVAYNIYYDDYESDPSKKQYWQYTHTPFNDGLHPDNEKILNAPIERFYIDGKYVVRHWQEDNTGVAAYDKNSNIQEITFFIQGNAIAPEVTYINTVPETVKDGNDYKIEIGVDDQDKDVLDTAIELYKNGTLIYTYTRNNVAPVGGVYPAILSGYAPTASPGNYTVVATASDGTGIGLRSYDFIVVSEGRIEGMVNHTDQWNQNRISFNLAKSGTENNPRSYNIFWSGEAFVLIAETEGNPVSVDVEILNEGFSTSLSSTNQTLWTGELWDESMINKWGRETPESLTFRFTAYFTGGITRTDDVTIIIDDRETFWRLHRLY